MANSLVARAFCGKKKACPAKRLAKQRPGGETLAVDMEDTATKRRPSLLQRILIGGNIRWTMVRLLVLLAVTTAVLNYFFPEGEARYRRILVDGKSMDPTFVHGQTLWMHAREYLDQTPQRGDVVVLGQEGHSPFYLKRIIGLPGERVAIRRGQMTIDGTVYDEYGEGRIRARLTPLTLGEDEYFVLGDNRPISSGGVVEANKILGKIL